MSRFVLVDVGIQPRRTEENLRDSFMGIVASKTEKRGDARDAVARFSEERIVQVR